MGKGAGYRRDWRATERFKVALGKKVEWEDHKLLLHCHIYIQHVLILFVSYSTCLLRIYYCPIPPWCLLPLAFWSSSSSLKSAKSVRGVCLSLLSKRNEVWLESPAHCHWLFPRGVPSFLCYTAMKSKLFFGVFISLGGVNTVFFHKILLIMRAFGNMLCCKVLDYNLNKKHIASTVIFK